MMGVLGGVVAALLALGHPAAAPASFAHGGGAGAVYAAQWRCPAPVYWTVAGAPTAAQAVAIDDAVARMEIASGQEYVRTDSGPASLTITVVPRAQWAYDPTWSGYTWWTPAPTDNIWLRDDSAPTFLTALTMHELMLSRHIAEVDDPGGLLGHFVPRGAFQYSPADNAMLAATPCM